MTPERSDSRGGGMAGPTARAPWPGRAMAIVLCTLVATCATAPVGAPRDTGSGDDQEERRAGGPAVADMPAYCSIVGVDKVQLSNATIVTVTANGLLKTEADWQDFVVEDEPGNYDQKETTRFPIRIANARSQVGSFVDIDLYPISHLEITIPPDATEGIGLQLTTVLFTLGTIGQVALTDTDFEWYGGGVSLDILMTENKRGVILIARSDRHMAAAGRPAPARTRVPTPRLGVAYENEQLDVHAIGVTAARLLDEIGQQTGQKMALAQPSPAIASIHLEDMSLPAALEAIARAYGLGVARIDGGYVLAPGWPTGGPAYSFSWQRTFPVHHLAAEQAAELLPNVLDRHIHVDREHNAIVAAGAPPLLDKIAADLAKIDQPYPLIKVESVIVDMSRNYDLAAALDLQFADGNTSLTSVSDTADLRLRIVNLPLRRIRVALSALEERGIVETHAHAHLLTLGGQYSRVFGGVQQYYPYRTTRRGGQEITLRSADVGVHLGAWPSTGGEAGVRCYLRLTASNILSVNPEGLPLIARREAQTSLQLPEGHTVYVGGIELSQKQVQRKRVPLLGDIPLLGHLFRSRRHVTTERSLAIFLTLHTADGAAEPAPPTATTAAQASPAPARAAASAPLPEFERSMDG